MLQKVLVTRKLPEEPLKQLAQVAEIEFLNLEGEFDKRELIRRIHDKDALLCTIADPVDREVIESAPLLKIIANYGVGFNHIDLDYATQRGIFVTNTPGVLTDATADLAWALLLDVARRVSEGDRFLRKNEWTGWTPTFMLGSQVTGKTLGIIGMGRIGQAVAKRARGFEMRVLYYSRTRLPEEQEAECRAQFVDLPTLLKESDFVSLHCPYTPETHHLIGENELSMMKPSAYLINTARGSVVDEQALIRALKNGVIRGAALDVYEHEPQIPEELKKMEQVVLAPHLGSATEETRTRMAQMVVDNLLAFFQGQSLPNLVNTELAQKY